MVPVNGARSGARLAGVWGLVTACVVGGAGSCLRSAEDHATGTPVVLRARMLMAPLSREEALALWEDPAGRHAVVQLSAFEGEATLKSLASAGVTLLHPLGGHAFTARLPARKEATPPPEVRAVWALEAQDKLSAQWAAPPEHARLSEGEWAALVLVWPDVPSEEVAEVLEARLGKDAVQRGGGLGVLQVRASMDALKALALEDGVMWVEPLPPPPTSEMPRAQTAVNQPVVRAAPWSLDGAGVTVSQHDVGHAFAHQDLGGGRLRRGDADAGQPANVQLHPSMTAGTLAGDGTRGGPAGMAPAASVLSYDFTSTPCCVANQLEDMANANRNGAAVSNNSWGYADCMVAAYGAYTAETAAYDGLVRGPPETPDAGSAPGPLLVFSSGNERKGVAANPAAQQCLTDLAAPFANYGTVNQPKATKNALVVGSVDSANGAMSAFSGWGPVSDGRLKPELVAPGLHDGAVTAGVSDITNCFGTPTGNPNQQCYRATNTSNTSFGGYAWFSMSSASSAVVSGAAVLLTQLWRRTSSAPATSRPPPALLRAALVHSATDLDDATAWFNPGPDYASGYGRLDLGAAATLLGARGVVTGCVQQDGVFRAWVPNGLAVQGVRATLAWDDAPGTPLGTAPALVNDLDLVVTDPAGTRVYPWTLDPQAPSAAARQDREDHLNNLEQVMAAPFAGPGTWRIQVRGTRVLQGEQCFALALSPVNTADADADQFPAPLDCDDTDPLVRPGAPQACDSVNNDCADPAWPLCGSVDCALFCDDRNTCTRNDRCEQGACVGTVQACEDGNPCTTGVCTDDGGCTQQAVAEGVSCADVDACNGTEVCAAGVCTPGPQLNCDDQDPCTADGCEADAGCTHAPVEDGVSCADADLCNGTETCRAGACSAGTPLECTTTLTCRTALCVPTEGCVTRPVEDGTPCPDDTVCNGMESCVAGACAAGTPLACDDGLACSVDTCDARLGCAHAACPDAGAAPDAAVPDASVVVAADAGAGGLDASVPLDAGSVRDAATASPDAALADAAAGDAARTDGGSTDGASAVDGAAASQAPGRTEEPSSSAPACRCAVGREGVGVPALGLMVLGLSARRRRRGHGVVQK